MEYNLKMSNVSKVVDKAMNGYQALQKVIKNVEKYGYNCYEFILMDCNMPVMDGCTATQQLRDYLYLKKIPQPIITAVTGHVEQSYVRKAYLNGMNQVVSKPIDQQLLMQALIELDYIKNRQ